MVVNTRTKQAIGAWPQTGTSLRQIETILDGQVKQFFVGSGTAAEILDAVATPSIDASLIDSLSAIDCSGGSITINLPNATSPFTESHRSGDGLYKMFCMITSPSPSGTATITGTGFAPLTLSGSNPTATLVWQGNQWNLITGKPPVAPTGLAPWYVQTDPSGDNAWTFQQNIYDPYPNVNTGVNRLVFGATSSEQPAVPAVENKMMFSNMDAATDHGSFSAGIMDSTSGNPAAWDLANRGAGSTRLGNTNQASAQNSSCLAGQDSIISASGSQSATVAGVGHRVDAGSAGVLAGNGHVLPGTASHSSVLAGQNLTGAESDTAFTQNFSSVGNVRSGFQLVTGPASFSITSAMNYVIGDAAGGSVDFTLPLITAANDRTVYMLSAINAVDSASHHVTVTATAPNLIQVQTNVTASTIGLFGTNSTACLIASLANRMWYNFDMNATNGTGGSPWMIDGSGNVAQDIKYSGESYNSNLLFGGSSISQSGIPGEQQKLYFISDSSVSQQGALSAGVVTGTQWDLANVGQASVRFGTNNTALAVNSSALCGHDHNIRSTATNSTAISGNSLTVQDQNTAQAQSLYTTGSVRSALRVQSGGTATLGASNHYVLANATSGNVTINLPAISGASPQATDGQVIHITATLTGANTVTVNTAGVPDVIWLDNSGSAGTSITLSSASESLSVTLVASLANTAWFNFLSPLPGGNTTDLPTVLHTGTVTHDGQLQSLTTNGTFGNSPTYIQGLMAALNLDLDTNIATIPPGHPGPLGITGNLFAVNPSPNMVYTGTSTTVGGAGQLELLGGTGATAGGTVFLGGGFATAGTGGTLTMFSGSGTVSSGGASLKTSNGTLSGNIIVTSGDATTATGGLTLSTGLSTGAGSTGTLQLNTGNLTTSSGTSTGLISLHTGDCLPNIASGNQSSGTITASTGSSFGTANSGAINLSTGAPAPVSAGIPGGRGASGDVQILTGPANDSVAHPNLGTNSASGNITISTGDVLSNDFPNTRTSTRKPGSLILNCGDTNNPLTTTECSEIIIGGPYSGTINYSGRHICVVQNSLNQPGGAAGSGLPQLSAGVCDAYSSDIAGGFGIGAGTTVSLTYRNRFNTTGSQGAHVPFVVISQFQATGPADFKMCFVSASSNTGFTVNNPSATAAHVQYMVIGGSPWLS